MVFWVDFFSNNLLLRIWWENGIEDFCVGIECEYNRWSRRAIKSFAMAELEARKLKYPTTGTEALLMGILIEGISFHRISSRMSSVII